MIVPSILGSFCNLHNNICLAEEDLRLYLLTLAPGPEYLVYLGAKTLSSFWYFAGVLTIYNAIIYTSLQSTCIKKKVISIPQNMIIVTKVSFRYQTLPDILLIMTNSFQTVKQTILPTDSISLIKFDHLLFAPRSGQGQYFPLN